MGSIVIYLMILLMQTLLILEYTIAEGKVGYLNKCLTALCSCLKQSAEFKSSLSRSQLYSAAIKNLFKVSIALKAN